MVGPGLGTVKLGVFAADHVLNPPTVSETIRALRDTALYLSRRRTE